MGKTEAFDSGRADKSSCRSSNAILKRAISPVLVSISSPRVLSRFCQSPVICNEYSVKKIRPVCFAPDSVLENT